ncbi:MAG: Mur ligase family protein [Dehalococcoidia bacterium]|nr:Mur ligase family protein [Dehalococcoidia bacterium]
MKNSKITKIEKDYINVINKLSSRSNFEKDGQKLKDENWKITHIREYLNKNENFDKRNTIHIAGSKGKGSTAHFINGILLQSRKNIYLFTSPDIHSVTERIIINGQPISKKLFTYIAKKYVEDIFFDQWSYFELLTLIGWKVAEKTNCDWQIIETGLGGRLDATNAMTKKIINVITPIDYEHTEILGKTINKIAKEKTGIVKYKEEVIIAKMPKSRIKIIEEQASLIESKIHKIITDCKITYKKHSIDYQIVDIDTPLEKYKNIQLNAIGKHQAENAASAIRACEIAWQKVYKEKLPYQYVKEGLSQVKLPGRIEKIRENPLILLDGMHSQLSAKRLEETLTDIKLPKKRIVIFGSLQNKKIDSIAKQICNNKTEIIITQPKSSRAMSINKIKSIFAKYSSNIHTNINIDDALKNALEKMNGDQYILITGSIYLISEAREKLLSIDGDRKLNLR